jgi:hypothetical protein
LGFGRTEGVRTGAIAIPPGIMKIQDD